MRNDDFSVVFSMPNQKLLTFVRLFLIDPHSLFTSYQILMLIVRFEQLGQLIRSAFDGFSRKLLEISSWCAWSQVKLIDVYYFEFVMSDQFK